MYYKNECINTANSKTKQQCYFKFFNLQRFVKLPNDVDNMLKEDLLQLYYKFILPKPQRKYRLNRRGREMTKKQIIQARKRKNTQPDTAEPSSKYAVL